MKSMRDKLKPILHYTKLPTKRRISSTMYIKNKRDGSKYDHFSPQET